MCTGLPKNLAHFGTPYNFAKCWTNFQTYFRFQNREKICDSAITKKPTTPQVCRYTTLRNVSVFKLH